MGVHIAASFWKLHKRLFVIKTESKSFLKQILNHHKHTRQQLIGLTMRSSVTVPPLRAPHSIRKQPGVRLLRVHGGSGLPVSTRQALLGEWKVCYVVKLWCLRWHHKTSSIEKTDSTFSYSIATHTSFYPCINHTLIRVLELLKQDLERYNSKQTTFFSQNWQVKVEPLFFFFNKDSGLHRSRKALLPLQHIEE